jgi:hypothetical protein
MYPDSNRSASNIFPAKGISLIAVLMLIFSGILAYYQPVLVSIIWASIFFLAIYGFITGKMKHCWYGIVASPAMEVLARMSVAPGMPYEVGKYFLLFAIVLMVIKLLMGSYDSSLFSVGGIILFALLPATIVNMANFDFEQWVFNALAILELAILLIIAARERWHVEEFCRMLQIALTAILLLVVYITVRSPLPSEVEFSLKANAATSGGFGSNQVATVIGAGIVLTTLLMILRRPFFSFQPFNYIFLLYLLFRGLMTFSRGGMIVALVAVAVAFMPNFFRSFSSFIKYSLITVVMIIATGIVFLKVNDLTGNMLLLRYQGETAGTYEGGKDKTLNTVLSGRGDIARSDIAIFRDYWLFGAGAGESKKLRSHYGFDMDVAAHTEYTRLLSEEGIGGLFTVILLFVFPFYWVYKQSIGTWRGVIGALFVLGLFTAFHAAMRTNTTIVFYVLATIPVLYGGYNYHAEEEG